MVKHIQDPKTGKFAGSIGDGKTKTPTAAPKLKNPQPAKNVKPVNPFFEGKPAWFAGYAQTLANYVIQHDTVEVPGRMFLTQDGPLLKHFKLDNCKMGAINELSETVETESSYDTFGNGDSPVCYVFASVDCECRKFINYQVSVKTTIDDALSEAFAWEKNARLQANTETTA